MGAENICSRCGWSMQAELDQGYASASRSMHEVRGGKVCSTCLSPDEWDYLCSGGQVRREVGPKIKKKSRVIDAIIDQQLFGHESEWNDCEGSEAHPFRKDRPQQGLPIYVPYYSTQIADAWKVVEELRKHGIDLSICSRSDLDPSKNNCDDLVALKDMKYQVQWWDDEAQRYVPAIFGKTAPEAICNAALKLLSENPELKKITEMNRRKTVRAACRDRMPLDGADAQALEHALTQVEVERDRYKAALEKIREGHGVPCPAEGCGFPHCSYCLTTKALYQPVNKEIV